jgi:Uma2 family endonuclease
MPAMLAKECRLTIDEFLSMVETRPDGERWELIEGIAIMNASPSDWHQQIVANVIRALLNIEDERGASWSALPGISTRVPASIGSLPRPDIFVKEGPTTGAHTTEDGLILFEVLSKSNKKADQAWRRRVYASIPNCQHYVTIAVKTAEVVRYDRADGWKGVKSLGLGAELILPVVDVTLPLRDIYRKTPIE